MKFGEALDKMKEDPTAMFTCEHLSGLKAYFWLKSEAHIESSWCRDPVLKRLCDANGGTVHAYPTLCMYLDNGEIYTGYNLPESMMLRDDWVEAYPSATAKFPITAKHEKWKEE